MFGGCGHRDQIEREEQCWFCGNCGNCGDFGGFQRAKAFFFFTKHNIFWSFDGLQVTTYVPICGFVIKESKLALFANNEQNLHFYAVFYCSKSHQSAYFAYNVDKPASKSRGAFAVHVINVPILLYNPALSKEMRLNVL